MYFDLIDASQDLVCRVSDLLAERDDLKRRLAESEAGAAVLRAAIEKLAACDGKEEAWSELNRTEFEATRYCTGRRFLVTARKCRDALKSYPGRAMVGEAEHYNWIVDCKAALAAIEPFLGGA